MKYIEIKPEELSVLRSSIVAVERREEVFSRIYTTEGIFESELPYRILLDLLEGTEEAEMGENIGLQRKIADSLETLERNSQTFAG